MADELIENAEYGRKRKNEEDPILVAQRFLNIYRQMHIFNKQRQEQFDNMLLELPPDIRILLSTLPGGSVLLEHIEELEQKHGVAVPPAVKQENSFRKKNAKELLKNESSDEKVSSRSGSGGVVIDSSFATELSTSLSFALQQTEKRYKDDIKTLTETITQSIMESQSAIANMMKDILMASKSAAALSGNDNSALRVLASKNEEIGARPNENVLSPTIQKAIEINEKPVPELDMDYKISAPLQADKKPQNTGITAASDEQSRSQEQKSNFQKESGVENNEINLLSNAKSAENIDLSTFEKQIQSRGNDSKPHNEDRTIKNIPPLAENGHNLIEESLTDLPAAGRATDQTDAIKSGLETAKNEVHPSFNMGKISKLSTDLAHKLSKNPKIGTAAELKKENSPENEEIPAPKDAMEPERTSEKSKFLSSSLQEAAKRPVEELKAGTSPAAKEVKGKPVEETKQDTRPAAKETMAKNKKTSSPYDDELAQIRDALSTSMPKPELGETNGKNTAARDSANPVPDFKKQSAGDKPFSLDDIDDEPFSINTLKNTPLSLEDIAGEPGFDNPSLSLEDIAGESGFDNTPLSLDDIPDEPVSLDDFEDSFSIADLPASAKPIKSENQKKGSVSNLRSGASSGQDKQKNKKSENISAMENSPLQSHSDVLSPESAVSQNYGHIPDVTAPSSTADDQEWEWEYVDEDDAASENDEDWEWEYVEDDETGDENSDEWEWEYVEDDNSDHSQDDHK